MTDYNTLVIWSAYDVLGAADLNANFANADFLKTQVNKGICQGRLALESGVPISTTDQTAKTTLYFTPYLGDLIALYDGTASWDVYTFSELSLTNAGLTASQAYDVFCYLSGGSPALELLAWDSMTARATALTLNGSNWVKSGDATRRYLGSVWLNSSSQFTDAEALRYVWNCHNRVARLLYCKDTTNSWTYSTAAWRGANGSTVEGVARIKVMIGLKEDMIRLVNRASTVASVASNNNAYIGVGLDSDSVNSAQVFGSLQGSVGNSHAIYEGYPDIGFHYFTRLEYANPTNGATITWYGDNGGVLQSGMLGHVMA